MRNRDLGLNHGAGKGDADRTDRAKYVAGLRRIKGLRGLTNKEGFTQIGATRWSKSFGVVAGENRRRANSKWPE